MTVGRDPNRKTWHFVIDLPVGPDGRRRQMRRRGFRSERVARDRVRAALQRFGEARRGRLGPPTGAAPHGVARGQVECDPSDQTGRVRRRLGEWLGVAQAARIDRRRPVPPE